MKAFRSAILIIVFLLFSVATLQAADVQVTLVWDANTEPDLAGYKIYWGTESRTTRTGGGYPNSVDIGNKTTGDVFPLTDSTNYFFAATAYDTAGNESNFSNEVAYTTPDLTGPNAPVGVRVTVSVKVDVITTP